MTEGMNPDDPHYENRPREVDEHPDLTDLPEGLAKVEADYQKLQKDLDDLYHRMANHLIARKICLERLAAARSDVAEVEDTLTNQEHISVRIYLAAHAEEFRDMYRKLGWDVGQLDQLVAGTTLEAVIGMPIAATAYGGIVHTEVAEPNALFLRTFVYNVTAPANGGHEVTLAKMSPGGETEGVILDDETTRAYIDLADQTFHILQELYTQLGGEQGR